MTNNRIRCLIIFIVTGLLIFLIVGTIIYLVRRSEHRVVHPDACPRPKQYQTNYDYDYTKNSKEFRNTDSSVDYFQLSLSWSPTFCGGKQNSHNLFQCQHVFGFVVHGLWPSKTKTGRGQSNNIHPRNCRNEPPIPADVIKKYFCLMPSEKLMQDEWEKHGTCYWQKPEDYFEKINYLYSKINIPNNINDILNNGTLGYKSIKQSFIDINPQLKWEEINVMMRKNKLHEVAFCYDLNFNHIKCI
ncbi:unnamed protein product [Adineta steineri]|uniref:Uncharacterized protein n=1 Tax=Adineta steineri TaxID=433720 RepID=A0A815JWR6_9BILA|nr:unnamed protein product [Adineta steineri]CAF1387693.1 unnamed protein product [Adineta steineri]